MASRTRGARNSAAGKATDFTQKKGDSRRGIEGRGESKAGRNMGDQQSGGAMNKRPDLEGLEAEGRNPVGKDARKPTTRRGQNVRRAAAARNDSFDNDLHTDKGTKVNRQDNTRGSKSVARADKGRSGKRSHRSRGRIGK